MKIGQLIAFAAALGLSAGYVSAADVTFDASGTFGDGSTLSGSLVIDTALGIVQPTGMDLIVSGGTTLGASGSLTFDTLSFAGEEESYGPGNVWYAVEATDSADSGPRIELDLDLVSATNLMNYDGGALCFQADVGNNCGDYVSSWILEESSQDPNLVGTTPSPALAPSSAPEPASIWLLAVPAVWVIRRRATQAASPVR